jgi:hypothetical protein
MQTKTEKLYEATAKKLGEFWRDSPQAAGEFADLAFDLADEFEAIDPGFDRNEFLAVAQPDA